MPSRKNRKTSPKACLPISSDKSSDCGSAFSWPRHSDKNAACGICDTALPLTLYNAGKPGGLDVQTKLPHLATYLGHVSPVSTHYYLRFTPELRRSASQRFHQRFAPLF